MSPGSAGDARTVFPRPVRFRAHSRARTHTIEEVDMGRDAQLRSALEFALAHSDAESATTALIGALGALIEDQADAQAFEMAQSGILALVRRGPRERDAARVWHAQRHGFDPELDAVAIVDLCEAVERAAYLYNYKSAGELFKTGDAAIDLLRAGLVERFGTTVPGTADLVQWFSRLGIPKSQGGLTTAGIAARIIHEGRLLGDRRDTLDNTLSRVDRVLSRLAKRRKEQEKRLFHTPS